MPPLQAIYHSIRSSERIPMRVSPARTEICLASYQSFQSSDSYRHGTASSHILFDSSRRVDSIKRPPDSVQLLVVELTSFLTLGTQEPPAQNYAYSMIQSPTVMPPPRAIYHSTCLSERIPKKVFSTLAETCLVSYDPFQATDSYRHFTASSHIPFDSS